MEKEINQLIQDCVTFFSDNCYSKKRIDKYRSLWRCGISRFMKEKELVSYSPSVGQDYVSSCIPGKSIGHEDREKVRSIQVLDDYIVLGYIRKRTTVQVNHVLDGAIGVEMQKLINHLINLRRGEVTIRYYKLYLSYFLKHLKDKNVPTVNDINEYHIIQFLSTRANNKVNIASALRVLFRYWFENHITSTDKEQILDNYKWVKKERIPSFYEPGEIIKIESSIDRASGTGKRDYAMLLLATRLGLRASDIANLAFSNIDWKRNEIQLVQCKTKEMIILPLLADVGNGIIDYLKNGRFQSEHGKIFISSRAPYVPATKYMVSSALNRVISAAGVSIKYRHHGPHSMRHSLASTLLKNGIPIPVISEVLGHKTTISTMTYLKIDISSLLKCALPVMPVREGFYTQKGGAFYE